MIALASTKRPGETYKARQHASLNGFCCLDPHWISFHFFRSLRISSTITTYRFVFFERLGFSSRTVRRRFRLSVVIFLEAHDLPIRYPENMRPVVCIGVACGLDLPSLTSQNDRRFFVCDVFLRLKLFGRQRCGQLRKELRNLLTPSTLSREWND